MALLVCRTCPRYDLRRSGEFGTALTAALASEPAVHVRNVQCLGGCPDDGVAAVDGPGKPRVRFTGLDVRHAAALIEAARAHDACATGTPGDWDVPAELADHVSAVTLKRGPLSA